jgi:hypothetical protein
MVSEKRQHLCAFQLLFQACLSPIINTMNLKKFLPDRSLLCSNVHIGRLIFADYKTPTLALLMLFGKGVTIPLIHEHTF